MERARLILKGNRRTSVFDEDSPGRGDCSTWSGGGRRGALISGKVEEQNRISRFSAALPPAATQTSFPLIPATLCGGARSIRAAGQRPPRLLGTRRPSTKSAVFGTAAAPPRWAPAPRPLLYPLAAGSAEGTRPPPGESGSLRPVQGAAGQEPRGGGAAPQGAVPSQPGPRGAPCWRRGCPEGAPAWRPGSPR